MFRVMIGSVVCGVVLFFWGFVFWTKLPLADHMMEPFPNEEAIVSAIEALPHSGTYFFPYIPKDQMVEGTPAMDAHIKRHEKGPIGMIQLHKEGTSFMGPKLFLMGFLHFVVTSFLAGSLLYMASPGLSSWGSRVLFVSLLGIFGSVGMILGNPIWFYHPWKSALIQATYEVSSWILGGIVLGTIIRQRV